MNNKYYRIFKPGGMLSQFTQEAGHATLGELFTFPKDVYPIGRLDHDTEGLLLLTNDTKVNLVLLNPKFKHQRTYWAQVEGEISEDSLNQLKKGVTINLKGTLHKTLPAKVKNIQKPGFIEERNPSVNYVKHPVTSWIELILAEGKNRQVRKMTAKVGHPTLRLIRYGIEEVNINGMKSGDVVEMKADEFFQKLRINI